MSGLSSLSISVCDRTSQGISSHTCKHSAQFPLCDARLRLAFHQVVCILSGAPDRGVSLAIVETAVLRCVSYFPLRNTTISCLSFRNTTISPEAFNLNQFNLFYTLCSQCCRLVPAGSCKAGDAVYSSTITMSPTPPKVLKSELWRTIAAELRADNGRATYKGQPLVTSQGEVLAHESIPSGAPIR